MAGDKECPSCGVIYDKIKNEGKKSINPETAARASEAHVPETNDEKKLKEELTCNLPSSKWIGGIEVLQGNIRKGLKHKIKSNEKILLCIKGKNEALVFLDSRLLIFETKSVFLQSGVKDALSYNYSDIRKIGTVKVRSLQSAIAIELNNGNTITKIQLGPLKRRLFKNILMN